MHSEGHCRSRCRPRKRQRQRTEQESHARHVRRVLRIKLWEEATERKWPCVTDPASQTMLCPQRRHGIATLFEVSPLPSLPPSLSPAITRRASKCGWPPFLRMKHVVPCTTLLLTRTAPAALRGSLASYSLTHPHARAHPPPPSHTRTSADTRPHFPCSWRERGASQPRPPSSARASRSSTAPSPRPSSAPRPMPTRSPSPASTSP